MHRRLGGRLVLKLHSELGKLFVADGESFVHETPKCAASGIEHVLELELLEKFILSEVFCRGCLGLLSFHHIQERDLLF